MLTILLTSNHGRWKAAVSFVYNQDGHKCVEMVTEEKFSV